MTDPKLELWEKVCDARNYDEWETAMYKCFPPEIVFWAISRKVFDMKSELGLPMWKKVKKEDFVKWMNGKLSNN